MKVNQFACIFYASMAFLLLVVVYKTLPTKFDRRAELSNEVNVRNKAPDRFIITRHVTPSDLPNVFLLEDKVTGKLYVFVYGQNLTEIPR